MLSSILLWCAQTPWLSTHVPRWGFAKRAVKRFMPGEELEAAVQAAVEFKAQGIGSLLTRLGENVKTLAEAREVLEHYEAVFARGAEAALNAEVSVKPTQLGLDIYAAAAVSNL